MQAGLFKRICAYIIDIIIINIILSIVTFSLDTTNNYSEKMLDLTNKYTKNEITYEEFSSEYNELIYSNQKDNYIYYVVNFAITIGYFIVFQGLNKGQTLGKKILKLKVVTNDNKEIEMKNIILRSLPLYSVLSLLIITCFIKVLNMKTYSSIYIAISSSETIFTFITILFILYRKDKRGLHDIIANTKVISE